MNAQRRKQIATIVKQLNNLKAFVEDHRTEDEDNEYGPSLSHEHRSTLNDTLVSIYGDLNEVADDEQSAFDARPESIQEHLQDDHDEIMSQFEDASNSIDGLDAMEEGPDEIIDTIDSVIDTLEGLA